VEIVWDIDLNLPNGSYDLGIHLEDVDTGLYHEHNFRTLNLLIGHDSRYVGKYVLNPTVELDRRHRPKGDRLERSGI
jgi:hypothetical protein